MLTNSEAMYNKIQNLILSFPVAKAKNTTTNLWKRK